MYSVCTSIVVHVLNKISYVVRNDEGNVLHAEFAVTQSQARNPVVGYHVVPTSARKLNYHTRWEKKSGKPGASPNAYVTTYRKCFPDTSLIS